MKTLVVLLVFILAMAMLLPSAQAADPNVFKVVFLMAETPEDHGWNGAHWRGIQELKQLGAVVNDSSTGFTVQLAAGRLLEVSTIQKIGYAAADIERFATQAVKNGANLVVGTWWDSGPVLAALAEQYPDVLFEHISGYPFIKSNGHNLSTFFIKQEQGGYVTCVLLARMGYHKVGIVATQMIPEPVREVAGCLLGLQSVWPDATVRTVWINSWLDQDKERFAAQGLIDEGFSAIKGIADTPYSQQATCEEPGLVATGYGSDAEPFAPCTVISNTWNWGVYYVPRVQAALDGTWRPGDLWWGMAEGAVGIVGKGAPYVQDVVDKLKAGFNPFCDFTGEAHLANGTVQTVEVKGCLTDNDLLQMQFFPKGYEGLYPTVQQPVVLGQ